MKHLIRAGAVALAAWAAVPAWAQHQGHAMPAASGSQATEEYMAANAKMHAAMSAPMTGDADIDFMKGMIAHHQGAIDMSKVALNYGKDPQARKLAEDIIRAQESEIAMIRDWLAKRGVR